MRRLTTLFLVALGLSLLIYGIAAGSDSGSEENTTAEGGIYTEEQAERGRQAYFQSCASCHGIRLNGGMGPALTGQSFMSSRGSDTVKELFDYTKANMPLGLGGSLSDQTYADIIAFILSNNEHPAGGAELTAESEAMTATRVKADVD